MKKTAFIFPGQGSQYFGMGRDFYEQEKTAREVYDLASQVTGLDLPALCFEENDRLHVTEYTQIAMLTTEVALLQVLKSYGAEAQVNAGLSLGEYAAMVSSGVVTLADAFAVVRKRGILMQEAYPVGGAMTAVLGLSADAVEPVCQEVCGQGMGYVGIANYNCPGQIVITGAAEAVAAAAEKLQTAGARRCMPLKVSGPFHSPLLQKAGEQLGEALQNVELQNFNVPYISNVTADYVTGPSGIKELLEKQVYSPVRWQQSVERMLADGVELFVEIGPGKTLSGFMKRIDTEKKASVCNLDRFEDLESVLAALKTTAAEK